MWWNKADLWWMHQWVIQGRKKQFSESGHYTPSTFFTPTISGSGLEHKKMRVKTGEKILTRSRDSTFWNHISPWQKGCLLVVKGITSAKTTPLLILTHFSLPLSLSLFNCRYNCSTNSACEGFHIDQLSDPIFREIAPPNRFTQY